MNRQSIPIRYAASYYSFALFPSVLQGFRLARNNSLLNYFNMLQRNALRLSLLFNVEQATMLYNSL